MEELVAKARERGVEADELNEILKRLVTSKRAYTMKNQYIHADVVNRCRDMLLTFLNGNDIGIGPAAFRDLISANRKIAVLLLEIYDHEKIIKRLDDVHCLTDAGREYLRKMKQSTEHKQTGE
jgi:hypothetical protein